MKPSFIAEAERSVLVAVRQEWESKRKNALSFVEDNGRKAGYAKGSRDGHAKGKAERFAFGKKLGLEDVDTKVTQARKECNTRSYQVGHQVGHKVGKDEGLAEGQSLASKESYVKGKRAGGAKGFTEGHAEVLEEGEKKGFLEGHEAGIRERSEEAKSELKTARVQSEYLGFLKAMMLSPTGEKPHLPGSSTSEEGKYWWGRAVAWTIFHKDAL